LRDYFRDAAEHFGLHFVDMTEVLQAEILSQAGAQRERLLYFPYNVQYTAEGHRVVGQALSEVVEALP